MLKALTKVHQNLALRRDESENNSCNTQNWTC